MDEAEEYFKKAVENNCLSTPHANSYGDLLIKERNEVEQVNKYLDLAEADGYNEEWKIQNNALIFQSRIAQQNTWADG